MYPGTSLYEHILWIHLEKKRTSACTLPVQCKEINIVKVRLTMRYSSRKWSHKKVITTACNFWRQIACSFLVKSGKVLLSGKKIFEIPPFFQTRLGDLGKKVHAWSLRFSALNIAVKVIPLFCTAHPLLHITLRHPRWQRFFPLARKEQTRAPFAELKLLFAIMMPQIGWQLPGLLQKKRKMKVMCVIPKSAVVFHFAAVELWNF